MTESEGASSRICSACHEASSPAARYCWHCGHALAGFSDPGSELSALRAASERPSFAPSRSARPAASGHPLHERATEPPHLADPLIGRTIAERYRILEQIGRGGMGVVYRVEHARIGKLMALKLLTGELTRDGVQVARFKREALMASRLSHPNTVQVFDFGMADGLVYLAMEYLRGEDLGRIIRREGSLSFERAAKLMIQVASSLAEAHDKGIVHRDLKPENIFVVRGHTGDEVVKVLDFGLAKLRESSELSDVTSRGAIVGTPYYMAPEQIRGEAVEPSSDIYSLGALMYVSLVGEPVFDANTPLGVFTKHLLEQPVAPHVRRPELRIPEGLSRLVMSALEKEPNKRPASALMLQEGIVQQVKGGGGAEVERLLSVGEVRTLTDEDGEAATRSEVERFEKKLRRRSHLAIALAVAALAAAVAGAVAAVTRLNAAPVFAGRELEPNDSASEATRVPFPVAVLGRLGQRIDRERSDRDFFRVSVPAPTRTVRLATSALPNMATCTSIYALGSESPLGRFCAGAPGRELVVDQLSLAAGDYVIAVMQDRDSYSRAGPPPVYENVSDDYRLELSAITADAGREIEPNDSERNPSTLSVPGSLRGQLSFMRDADVVCGSASGSMRFIVEDTDGHARPREAVLQVTALAGTEKGVPVRVHRAVQGFTPSARDIVSPWKSSKLESAGTPVCVELTLTPNPWVPNPAEVAPASDTEYVVHAEAI